jgi:TonB-dependent receptor
VCFHTYHPVALGDRAIDGALLPKIIVMLNKTITRLFLMMAGLFSFFVVQAQQVRGVVSDAAGTLPGAVVSIIEINISSATDLNGNFLIQNKKTGEIIIKITYVGHKDTLVTIYAKKGDNNIGTIKMISSPNALGAVIINGSSAGSQARALSIKKASSGIMEVLASNTIGKLPDRNAAEAIQRLEGVSIARDAGEGRYITVRGVPTQWVSSLLNDNHLPSASVDYVDRRIQMDIFPAELIEYVKLSKAVTPDMEGDNIGGSVNFVTRAAPTQRVLSASVAGGYNTLAQSGSYNASLAYGDRVLNNKLGFIVSGVIWDRANEINRYVVDYNLTNPNPVQSFSLADLQLRDYNIRRKTTGLNAGLEYVFNPRNKIYLKGLYSQFDDDQSVRETYFNYNAPSNVTVQTRHTINITKLKSVELGGNSIFSGKVSLDWAASLDGSSAESTNPATGVVGYPFVNFKQAMTYTGLSSDGKMYLKMDSPNGIGGSIDHVLPNNSTPVDPDKLLLNDIMIVNLKNNERNERAATNLKYAVNSKLNLKFGAKFQDKYKSVDNSPVDVYVAGILGAAPALSSFQTEPYPFNGGFLKPIGSPYNNVIINQLAISQVPVLATPASISKYKLSPAETDEPNNATGAPKYYHGTEDVYATYFMGDYKLTSKVTLITGVRDEYNDNNYSGNLVLTTASPAGTTISPLSQRERYNVLLPMFHLKYEPDNNDVIRFAYTEGYARPDFGSLNPATIQNALTQTITQGNPELKPTHSYNFDLMVEHYFEDVGILNGGAFYKRLTDFIYSSGSGQTIDGINYMVSQPENLPSAWLYGFEGGIAKRFVMLPGFWKGFGVQANYTFVNSQTNIPRLVSAAGVSPGKYVYDATTLPQQARNLFNMVLFYEKDSFSARIASNFKGQSVTIINSAYGPGHYIYTASNITTDFTASYAITRQLRVFIELNNLTNEPIRDFMGTYNRVYIAEWSGARGQTGISMKLY